MPLKAWQRSRLPWMLLKWPLGGAFAALSWCARLGARERLHGAVPRAPVIYIAWHRYIPHGVIWHGRRRHWHLISSAPYMAPIAAWTQLVGMRNPMTPPGAPMREALQVLARALGRGESVVLYVDGPAGPPEQAKAGCVTLARQTGAPLVPFCYRTQRDVRAFWRWDHAIFSLPGEQVDFFLGAPMILPADLPQAEALQRVNQALQSAQLALAAG